MFIAKLNKTARFAISCKIENLFKIMQPPPQKKKSQKNFSMGFQQDFHFFILQVTTETHPVRRLVLGQ